MENNIDKNNNDEVHNSNENNDLLKKEIILDVNIQTTTDNEEKVVANLDFNNDSTIKTKEKNKFLFLGVIALLAVILIISLNNKTNVFQNGINNTPILEFTIEENGVVRDRTASEMREFYTQEGEEFIKAIYPDTQDSDFALLNIGREINTDYSKVEFVTATNEVVKLKNLIGKKIILDFALTTCSSCQEELTYMSTKKLDEDIVLLTIFPRNTTEDIKNILKELNITMSMNNIVSSTGMNNLSFEDFNITHVPAKLYINENGVVTYVTTNSILDDELYEMHYERAFGKTPKVLDFLKK